MVRRRATPVERYSELANWSRRLGLFALPVAAIAIGLSRTGLVETLAALGVFAAALLVAGAAVGVALAAFLAIWNEGYRGFGRALSGFLLGLAVLAAPLVLGVIGAQYPVLNDVTTDPTDPPPFLAGARARPAGANPVTYPGADTFQQQRIGYPDIRAIEKDWPAPQAYLVALDIVTKRRWRILDQVPPRAGRDGRIEAVARSLVFGFRDDIVVRVRATPGGGARIDVRSASRFGTHDFGANARRIRALLQDIDAQQPSRRG